ncbi:hypothetical protein [Halorussus litoreus]|uniref:hypothetical protein n=1 Tax=Halorussus litoreus TaxID=1710536 RepID=UPI000E282C5D|nr:hypothetical protein [Halorussus litoreus]
MSVENCDHCDAEFGDEEAYLRHLRDEHGDDLGPIEQRRVAGLGDEGGGGVVAYAAAVGALALVGLLAYVLFFSGGGASGGPGGGGDGPSAIGSVHYHGTIDVSIGGQQIDFSQPRFQVRNTGNNAFHFENGNGTHWHGHAQDVTLAYAMGTLDIEVTDETVTYDGTTYGDDSGERAIVEVNGESVDPASYVLQKGDHVRIVANESG